ncbi:hypothetical protein [Flavobacterium laiguense]|uniref:Uncharacterized protein n=1 Tax=Flavobacterium laiguense TaxID=2169409 RepID=A0A2U1K1D8_9FLAO|nr:hypothetical protein [Flavobacterium laiguense]PWA10979.1 hypothetical protein DB891_03870 [Flavobacterium laiguense]
MYEIIQPYLDNAYTGILGGFVGWFFTRKKLNAEVTGSEIDNGVKVVDLYKSALDDLPIRYEERYKHIEEMSKGVEKLFEQQKEILLKEIEYHKQQAEYQGKQAAFYKKMYNDEVRAHNKYKREHP